MLNPRVLYYRIRHDCDSGFTGGVWPMNVKPVTVEALLQTGRKVQFQDLPPFMLSCIRTKGGVIGVASYRVGRTRPSRNQHTMLSAYTRENWFSVLHFSSRLR